MNTSSFHFKWVLILRRRRTRIKGADYKPNQDSVRTCDLQGPDRDRSSLRGRPKYAQGIAFDRATKWLDGSFARTMPWQLWKFQRGNSRDSPTWSNTPLEQFPIWLSAADNRKIVLWTAPMPHRTAVAKRWRRGLPQLKRALMYFSVKLSWQMGTQVVHLATRNWMRVKYVTCHWRYAKSLTCPLMNYSGRVCVLKSILNAGAKEELLLKDSRWKKFGT